MATNPRAVIGGNSPPDPIDVALEPFADTLLEAENWLDGAIVENEGQLKATSSQNPCTRHGSQRSRAGSRRRMTLTGR
jgi:hypothetical protein